MVRLVAEVPGELMLGLLAEQLDVRPARRRARCRRTRPARTPGAQRRRAGRRPPSHWWQIAWVRLLTVSLITTFRRAVRSVCLVMTGFAETRDDRPLAPPAPRSGRERHRDPDEVETVSRPVGQVVPRVDAPQLVEVIQVVGMLVEHHGGLERRRRLRDGRVRGRERRVQAGALLVDRMELGGVVGERSGRGGAGESSRASARGSSPPGRASTRSRCGGPRH